MGGAFQASCGCRVAYSRLSLELGVSTVDRTRQLLGHASLKTTMVYLHCVPVRTIKEPKSPLDF